VSGKAAMDPRGACTATSAVTNRRGQPLDVGFRAAAECFFGHDFSQVRVHDDEYAARSAADLGARAYTLDQHIVLGPSRPQLGSVAGDRLMAHELGHVRQHLEGRAAGIRQQAESEASLDAIESEADAGAEEFVQKHRDATIGQDESTLLALGPAPRPTKTPNRSAQPAYGLTVRSPTPCVPTEAADDKIRSSAAIEVDYFKDNDDDVSITLRDREAGDASIREVALPRAARTGLASFPPGIEIGNENHHYELEMIFTNKKGVKYGGLGRRRLPIRFEVIRLRTAPKAEHLLFAKAIYAEGIDAGEFPYVRDLVYNRIDWVKGCPGDASAFGSTITEALNRPGQFASVLNEDPKFKELEEELRVRSGPCQYTTAPRDGSPARARLINAAIDAEAAGDGNSHDFLYFRSDKNRPSTRAVEPAWRYSRGNYYWRIENCPPDRRPK
jgi:hypothetical protein